MIVHLFNSSSVSGPERLVLPALVRFRDQVLIVNLRENRIAHLRDADPLEEYARSLNLKYRSIDVRGRWDREGFRGLERLLSEIKPALVHAHAIKASVYLVQAKRLDKRNAFPMVSTHHGVHGLPDWKVRLYEWIYRKQFLPLFDRVIGVSGPDYDFLLQSGIDSARLRLQRNGIDGRYISAEDRPKEARRVRALWLPQEPTRDSLFLFGVVARLSQEKDHARMLQALSRLNRLPGGRDWRCLVFGMGDLEKPLKQLALQLGLEKRVLWMGYRHNVAEELAAFDLLLSFSKAEGLPINLIEVGWAGTPVMCTPVGGIQELIPDESYGFWVLPEESADATAVEMQRLLLPDAAVPLLALGRRFQERVTKEFTQAGWLERLRAIYAELSVTVS